MGRKFGKVGATLDGSRRWWSLPDDSARLTFSWLLWNRHGNALGLYTLPPMFLGVGLRCDLEDAEARLAAIERAGLIERAPRDVVRIAQWFTKQNPTRNPSMGLGAIKAIRDRSQIEDSLARSKTALEFAYCCLAGEGSWNTETSVYGQFTKELEGFLAEEVKRVPDLTLEAMKGLGLTPHDMAWQTIWAMVATSCGHDVRMMWDKREKETESENENERESETGNERLRQETEIDTETETGDLRPEKRAASGKKAAAGRGAGFQSIDDVQKALDRGEAGPAARRG